MTSGIPVKNYTTARCGHLIFHLDPHDKCMDCRKSKCDFHENCCDLCGSLSDSIIRNLRRLYLKNKRPVHQMSPSPSPSQSRCSSKARNTPIAELISSPKPSKKSKGSKATGKKAAGRVHTSDCTSTANTTATLPTKEVQHVVESMPHAVQLSGDMSPMCKNSVDSVNVPINDLTDYDHSNARGCVSVVCPQSQDVMSTNMQHQMRYLGSIPVSVTIPNLDSQHSVTAANASHMPCSTYTSGAHSSRQLPWTVSAIPMTEDNSNSVCGIGDQVSLASGRMFSGAQTQNLRPTEHHYYGDIQPVSPAPGRIMSVGQTHNLRPTVRQHYINENKAPCKSGTDAQGQPWRKYEHKVPCKSGTDAQGQPWTKYEHKAPCKSGTDAQGQPWSKCEHKAPCKSGTDAQGLPWSKYQQIPMRTRTISHQPQGSPLPGEGIETAQLLNLGPTERQYTTYDAGHSARDYYVSSKMSYAPDIRSPQYEDVSENENRIRYHMKRTHYSSSSDTDSQVLHNAKKLRYSEIHERETVKDRNLESVHDVYVHSDDSADNQVLTVKEYNNSTNKFIANITECEGGVQKNSGSSNIGGMFDNILGEASAETENYLLPASNTTKYMMNYFNTVLRGNTVKARKGMAWTEEELQDIPKVSATSKSEGLITKLDTKIVKRSAAFTMFDQPDMDKDLIYNGNKHEDKKLRDLETDTCSAIASNNRLELATQSAINLAIASVSEEEYDMRLKQELAPLLNAINESVRKSAYHLQRQYTNLRYSNIAKCRFA